MQIAFDREGNRISADKADKRSAYHCPLCGSSLILRQGDLNIPHFAHKSNECTDGWDYDMSEWHYSMQNRFPSEQREVVVEYMGKKHRADVLDGRQIIEFQHSPISIEEIEERNSFYSSAGYSVAWVFDVREQYASGAIYSVEHDSGLMFGWNNPKRCLQILPPPKECSKLLVIYLYWVDEDGVECFERVIWSSQNDLQQPNFKRFMVFAYATIDGTSEKLTVSDFFLTKADLLGQRLSELNCRYQRKYIGDRGHRQNEYTCPRTDVFGLKLSGEKGCSYCRYCAAICEVYNKHFEIYCCYPNQVNEVTNILSGYECSDIPRF